MKAIRGLGIYAAFCAGYAAALGEFGAAYVAVALVAIYLAFESALAKATA